MKTFKIVGNDMSDGYHTFDELYEHRCLLFVRLCLMQPENCAWRNDVAAPGWFILYLQLDSGQISYHIPRKHLHLIDQKINFTTQVIWDGHTSEQVLERLQK